MRDAADAGPRRLHLVGDDRDLGPDHAVQQRRLAGVRLADQRHEPAARRSGLTPRASSRRRAAPRPPPAAPRASRRPRPSAARPSSSRASTEKTGAWSGPCAVEVEIGRRRQAARLRPFLQRGLGVAADRARRGDPRRPRAAGSAPAPPRARRRGRPRRSPPPSRRRAARSCAGRRSASPSGPAGAPRRGRARPRPRRRSPCAPARSAAARARPRCAAGPGASSASAITRPSTRSPRNSSRWLWAPAAIEGWVSASISSSGRAKPCPSRASASAMARLSFNRSP